MSINEWTDERIAAWKHRHTDAYHGGGRETCEHCQLMIEMYGEMPPANLVRKYDSSHRSQDGFAKRPIPPKVRRTVWERDNFTCQNCGGHEDLSVDHIVPESKGGPNELSNYQTLCRRCNSQKGTR